MRFSVCSLNIHKGLGPLNIRPILSEVKAVVQKTGCKILCLQEVIGSHSGFKKKFGAKFIERQFEYIADSYWTEHAYGKNAVYPSGDHGNAILSKFRITENVNFDISLGGKEKRGLLFVRIQINPETSLHCYSTHLNLRANDRIKQAHLITEHINSTWDTSGPIILAGDFNDWKGELAPIFEQELGLVNTSYSSALNDPGKELKTFPASYPMLPLDRIYARGLRVRGSKTISIRNRLNFSDHLPVVTDFEL